MNNDETKRIQELFLAAMEVPDEQRDAWLLEHCRHHEELLREVRSLLLAHDGQHDDPRRKAPSDALEILRSASQPETTADNQHSVNDLTRRDREEAAAEIEQFNVAPGVDDNGDEAMELLATSAFSVSPPGYEILNELGRGGMGVVYRARQTSLNRIVALKMILAGGHASDSELARFQREAKAVARVQHPNIVQIFDVGEVHGCPYLSLEYVEGGALSQRMRGDPWNGGQASELIARLAKAVHVTHDAGIIHRDLKPANVLLKQAGSVADSTGESGDVELTVLEDAGPKTVTAIPKITDFGLARTMEPQEHQTVSGAFLGTPSYCAPEQAMGQMSLIGPQTDIYALGAILYELLTGRPPFKAGTILETLGQVVRQDPVAPRLLNLSVDRDLETICLKCLKKRPSDRYASALELAQDLERFQRGEPIQARPAGKLERLVKWIRRRPAAAGLLALSVVSVCVAVGMLVAFSYQRELKETNSQLRAAVRRERQVRGQAEARRNEAERQRDLVKQSQAALEARTLELERERDRGRVYLYDADMNLAARAWSGGRVGEMVRILSRQHPAQTGKDYRSFEWYYLRGLEQRESQRLLGSHFAIASNSNRLAIARENNVILFDAESLQVVRPALNASAKVSCVALSRDGSRVAAGAWDRSFNVWDVGDDQGSVKELSSFTVPKYPSSVALDASGKRVLTSEQSATVRVWDAESGRETSNYTDHLYNTSKVIFSPDGKSIVSGGADRRLVQRMLSNNQVARAAPNLAEAIWDVAMDPQGRYVATCAAPMAITFYEAGTLRRIEPPGGGPYSGACLAFNATGDKLVAGAEDGAVNLWSLDTGRLERTFLGHQGSVQRVAFLSDDRIISAGIDGTMCIWEVDADQMPKTLSGHSNRVVGLALNPRGEELVSASWDGTVRLFRQGKSQPLYGHVDAVMDVAFGPDGTQFASGGADGTIRIWETASGKETRLIQAHAMQVSEIAFHPEGSIIASVSSDKTGKLWDANTGELLHTLSGHADMVFTVAFHPDGEIVATGSQDGGIRLWDVKTGEQTGFLPEGNMSSIAFSPDGDTLAVTIGVVFHLHDWRSGKMIYQSEQHQALLTDVAFTPDGKRLITSHHDNYVKFWDLSSNRETLTLRDSDSPYSSLAISADGTRLAAGAMRDIRVWDISDALQLFQ